MIHHGDCVEALRVIPNNSIDAVITDPPYAEVDRDYGRFAESEWFDLMREVVKETKRILTPQGSAVFVLQPNMRKCGSMRLWLWEFLLETARDWNLIQDCYWWNNTTPPVACCQRTRGLMRPSVKYCLWFGPPDCYRNQDAVLLPLKEGTAKQAKRSGDNLEKRPCGMTMRNARAYGTAVERGGSTPFNLLTFGGNSSGAQRGHPAATPYGLCDWWVRYISRERDVILDPFCGSGTVGAAALRNGREFIGIEKCKAYATIADKRLRRVIQAAACSLASAC